MPQWVFYLVAMVFDAVTCALSTFYLFRSASGISRFVDSPPTSGGGAHIVLRSMSAMVKMCVMGLV
jgi:hypothetical protein